MSNDYLFFKKNELFSQSTLWNNHYDNFAQMYLLIRAVSQASDVAHGPPALYCFIFRID